MANDILIGISVVGTPEVNKLDSSLKSLQGSAGSLQSSLLNLTTEQKKGLSVVRQKILSSERLARQRAKETATVNGLTQATRTLSAAQTANGAISQINSRKVSSTGMAIQQLGYQTGDFLVQIQGGTNAMVAFGQQATQLVGVLPMVASSFGLTMGAAIGVSSALGIIIPLATAVGAWFMRTGDNAKKASDGVSNFTSALSDFRTQADISRQTVASLSEDFGDFAVEIKQLAGFLGEVAVFRALDSLNTSTAPFSASLSEVSTKLVGILDVMKDIRESDNTPLMKSEALGVYQDTLDSIQKTFGMMPEDIIRVQQALDSVNKAKGLTEVRDNALAALNLIKGMSFEAGRIPPELANAVSELEKVLSAAARSTAEVDGTAESARRLSGNLSDATNAAVQLRDVLNSIDKAGISSKDRSSVLRAQISAAKSGKSQAGAGAMAETSITLGRSGASLDQIARISTEAGNAAAEVEKLEKVLSGLNAPEKSGGGSKKADKDSNLEKLLKEQALRKELLTLSGQERTLKEEINSVTKTLGEESSKYTAAQIQGIAQVNLALTEQEKLQKQARSDMESVVNTMADSLGAGLTSMVDGTKSVKDAFKDMARAVIAELWKVFVVQKLVAGVKSLFGFADGGVFSGGSVDKKFADGGVVGSPTTFPMTGGKTGLMGEAGPEAIMPLKRGANGKLGVQMEGGGSNTTVIHQSFNFQANGDESVKRIIAEAAPRIASMTQQSMMDQRRRGGAMKGAFG